MDQEEDKAEQVICKEEEPDIITQNESDVNLKEHNKFKKHVSN